MNYAVKGIEHLSISVNDLDQALNFYVNLLGFNVVKSFESCGDDTDKIVGLDNCVQDIVILSLDGQPPFIELIHYLSPNECLKSSCNLDENTIGIRHICLVVENIKQLYTELVEQGIEFKSEPVLTDSGDYFAFAVDPDGNSIEFTQKHQ